MVIALEEGGLWSLRISSPWHILNTTHRPQASFLATGSFFANDSFLITVVGVAVDQGAPGFRDTSRTWKPSAGR